MTDSEARKTLLLVEDEAIIAMATQGMLEKQGYRVRTALSGEEAVKAAAGDDGIDLILMDIDLGAGMDGTEAAALILKQRDLPVVFLSSHMEPEIVEKTEKITSYGYVVKQSSPTVLDASIKMAFKLFAAKKKEEEKEAALRRSEEKYHTLFSEMLDGFALHEIVCDADGAPVDYRFLAVNPAFERMTGLKAAQLIGRTVLEVMPGTERHWIDMYGRVALSGEPALFENYASELKKYFKVTAFQPTPGQFACIFVEITGNKLTEEALKKSQLLLRSSIESPRDMIILSIDRQYRYLYFNSFHKEVMKAAYGKDVELGMNLLECITNDDDRIKAKKNYDRALAGERHSTIEEYGDLNRQIYETRYNPIINDENEIIGATAFSADVSKRMRSEAAMSESEARFRTLATLLPVGIYLTDIQGRCRYANPRWLRMAGLTLEEALGEGWKQGLHPEDREAVFAAWQKTVAAEGDWGLEYRFRTKEGAVTWVHGLAAPQRDEQGRTIGYVGANIDVTDSKRAQEELRGGEERMRAIVEGTPHLFFYVQDMEANTVYVSPTIETITGYPPGVWMERRDWFVTDAACNREARALTHAHLRGEGAGEPVRLEIRHAKGHPILLEAYEYPVRRGDRVVGLQGVAHDITERIRAEEALRESEERLRGVLFSMADWVWEVDENGIYTYSSEQGTNLLGYAREEIIGRTPFAFMPPGEAERMRTAFAGFASRREAFKDLENWNLKKTGERTCLLTSGVPIVDEAGRLRGYRGVDKDITDRKKAEEALQDTLRFQQALMEAIPSPVFYKDAGLRYIGCNKAFEDYIGMPRERFAGRTVYEIAPGELAERYDRADRELLDKGGTQTYEAAVAGGDGSRRDVIFHKAVFTDAGGNPAGIIGVIQDISERKRAEEGVQQSEKRFRALVEGHQDVAFSVDVDGRVEYVSPAIARITGKKREEMEGRSLFDVLAPPNREAFAEHMRKTLAAGSVVGEYPIVAAGGATRWIRASSSIREEAGRVAGIYGIIADISERKRVEEELRQAKDRYETFIAQAAEGVYRLELDEPMPLDLPVEEQIDFLYRHLILAECNPAFLEMYGIRDAAEILGKTQADLHGGTDNPVNRAAMRRFIESGYRIRNVVTEEVDSGGNRKYFSNNSFGVVQNGLLLRSWGTQTDITDLKRTEKLMETQYGISQAVHSSQDLSVLYGRIHELIAGIVNAGNFFIALLDAGGVFLEFPYFRDEMDLDSSPIRADDPQSLAVEVLRARRPLLLGEEQLEERYATGRNRVWGTKPKCWLGIPLVFRDSIIGVMALQDYRNGRAYGARELALLEVTARQIAVAIERKRTEDALRASEEAFKNYFNIGTVGMAVTSPDKGWIEVNDCLCRMLGYAKEELLRLTWAELTHPEDLGADVELFNETMAGRRDSYELDKRFIRKDGRAIHTRLFVTCQRDPGGQVRHFLASLVDISERKQAEEALRRSEATQAAALQMTKSGPWEYDVERDLFTFNDNFYRIFRTTAAAVGGYQMSSAEYARRFCHPEDAPMVAEETRQAIEASDPGFNRQVEHRIRYADGETGYVSVRFFIVKDDRGRTVKTYGVNQDISERKWAEAEIKRQLEEKNVLLQEVHHRIKNNFASVAGLLALQAREAAPEAAAALREAGSRVDSMRLLYDKLLRREDHQEAAAKEYVESLAAAVVEQFRGMAQVELELDVADLSLPPKRLFPLGIILNELLTNVMKHAFAGGKNGRIRLSLTDNAGRASLVLQDDGAGLPEGFDPEKAQGFGLMLVRMLTKQLGGTFTIKSGKKGTRSEIAFDAG